MDDYRIIVSGVYSPVTTIRLYDDTLQHVIEEHPEIPALLPNLPAMIGGMESALQNPSYIEASRASTYVYVDTGTTNRVGDPLRIAIKIVEGTSARVSTFFFATPQGARTYVYRRKDG